MQKWHCGGDILVKNVFCSANGSEIPAATALVACYVVLNVAICRHEYANICIMYTVPNL